MTTTQIISGETTVQISRMTYAQLAAWGWMSDPTQGTQPMRGYEVRGTTGALLGAMFTLRHFANSLHAEWYDPTTDDFYSAGDTPGPVLTQGVAYVLGQYTRHVGPVPAAA